MECKMEYYFLCCYMRKKCFHMSRMWRSDKMDCLRSHFLLRCWWSLMTHYWSGWRRKPPGHSQLMGLRTLVERSCECSNRLWCIHKCAHTPWMLWARPLRGHTFQPICHLKFVLRFVPARQPATEFSRFGKRGSQLWAIAWEFCICSLSRQDRCVHGLQKVVQGTPMLLLSISNASGKLLWRLCECLPI